MKLQERNKAIELRQKGFSLSEISKSLKVAKSSVSLWVSKVILSEQAQKRLDTKVTRGQTVSAENKKERTRAKLLNYYDVACREYDSLQSSPVLDKCFCSLLYWCEGGKHGNNFVQFTNSDPKLIQSFLKLLRSSFNIVESKFRICIHLHEYHDIDQQIDFWHRISQISKEQFIKPYIKKSAHKRIRKEYQGCCQIRYYDSEINNQITMTAKACLDKIIGA